MAITATVERFEGDLAVLLVVDQETVVNVHRSDLPLEVRRGGVLRLGGNYRPRGQRETARGSAGEG
jgi:Protein of unknown function (DUF3006)